MSSVVVVGSGVVGLCTAWNLARAGAEVTVVSGLDPEREIGWGSGAWVNASSKVRLGYPDHYTLLNQRGMTALHHLAEKLTDERWLHITGASRLFQETISGAPLPRMFVAWSNSITLRSFSMMQTRHG